MTIRYGTSAQIRRQVRAGLRSPVALSAPSPIWTLILITAGGLVQTGMFVKSKNGEKSQPGETTGAFMSVPISAAVRTRR